MQTLNALRNGSDHTHQYYDPYKLHIFGITSNSHGKRAGKLFDMVLVQLVLRRHVLGLLGNLVQEVTSLALRKRLTFCWHEAKPVICVVFYTNFILPREQPVCSIKDSNDKGARNER